jgi:hypothetical protein
VSAAAEPSAPVAPHGDTFIVKKKKERERVSGRGRGREGEGEGDGERGNREELPLASVSAAVEPRATVPQHGDAFIVKEKEERVRVRGRGEGEGGEIGNR